MKKIYEDKRKARLLRDGEKKRDSYGYILIRINSYIDYEHRYIWKKYNGKIPEGFMIHHKNSNPQDNKIENLECVSRKKHGEIHHLLNEKRKI